MSRPSSTRAAGTPSSTTPTASGTFDPDAAQLSWGRTVDFLRVGPLLRLAQPRGPADGGNDRRDRRRHPGMGRRTRAGPHKRMVQPTGGSSSCAASGGTPGRLPHATLPTDATGPGAIVWAAGAGLPGRRRARRSTRSAPARCPAHPVARPRRPAVRCGRLAPLRGRHGSSWPDRDRRHGPARALAGNPDPGSRRPARSRGAARPGARAFSRPQPPPTSVIWACWPAPARRPPAA